MKLKQVGELVLQSLEHEQGGVKVYTAALTCAQRQHVKTAIGASRAEKAADKDR
jgi:hypothetical protein